MESLPTLYLPNLQQICLLSSYFHLKLKIFYKYCCKLCIHMRRSVNKAWPHTVTLQVTQQPFGLRPLWCVIPPDHGSQEEPWYQTDPSCMAIFPPPLFPEAWTTQRWWGRCWIFSPKLNSIEYSFWFVTKVAFPSFFPPKVWLSCSPLQRRCLPEIPQSKSSLSIMSAKGPGVPQELSGWSVWSLLEVMLGFKNWRMQVKISQVFLYYPVLLFQSQPCFSFRCETHAKCSWFREPGSHLIWSWDANNLCHKAFQVTQASPATWKTWFALVEKSFLWQSLSVFGRWDLCWHFYFAKKFSSWMRNAARMQTQR